MMDQETSMERDHVNGMDDNRSAKIAKSGKPNIPIKTFLDQNVAAKVGHGHCRRTGTLNKIQNLVL